MLAHTSSVDENTVAQKSLTRGQKVPFGSKLLNNSNLPKTPSASSNNASKRRALGDISNRKGQLDDAQAGDVKTEKKSSKIGTIGKETETPSMNRKSSQEMKANGNLQRKTVNFTDQPSVITIKHDNIDQVILSKASQTQYDSNDNIERRFGRSWYEEREKIGDSYVVDKSVDYVNAYEKESEIYHSFTDLSLKEERENNRLFIAAFDEELELFGQQVFSGVIRQVERLSFDDFNDDQFRSSESETLFVFKDNWLTTFPNDDALPSDDLSV